MIKFIEKMMRERRRVKEILRLKEQVKLRKNKTFHNPKDVERILRLITMTQAEPNLKQKVVSNMSFGEHLKVVNYMADNINNVLADRLKYRKLSKEIKVLTYGEPDETFYVWGDVWFRGTFNNNTTPHDVMTKLYAKILEINEVLEKEGFDTSEIYSGYIYDAPKTHYQYVVDYTAILSGLFNALYSLYEELY